MTLIVDAYNVLHCSHVLPERYALVSARGLCWMLDRSRFDGGRMVVVCDGAPKPNDDPRIDIGRVELIYAGPGRDADGVIERLIEEDTAPRNLRVVSNDHRLRRAAKRRRAHPVASEQFLRELADALRNRRSASAESEKPQGPVDAEGWLRRFGFPETAGPSSEGLESETERWLRRFGYGGHPDSEEE